MAALIEACGWLFFAGAAAWTIARSSRQDATTTPWLWRLAVLAGAIAFRWPMLCTPHDFSPDESQSLAGAITLTHDPRFWVSVDGATAGPLHYFIQVPAALFQAAQIYFVSRLTALIVVLATFFVCGTIIRRVASAWIEQTLILSAAIAFAASRTSDFQHFSTELVPILLIAAALHLALEASSAPSRWRFFGIGLFLASAPLAKLQAGPLAAAIGLFVLVREIRARRSRSAIPLIVGAMAPLLIVGVYLTAVDAWPQAAVPYLFTNMTYVELGSMPFSTVIGDLVHFLVLDGYVAGWVCLSAAVVVLGMLWVRRTDREVIRLGAIAIGWVAVALVCALLPRRPFLHYAYLIMPGWLMLVGCAMTVIARHESMTAPSAQRRLAAALFIALSAVPVALHLARFDGYGWERAYFARWHDENVDLAHLIRPYIRQGDSMAIWGSRSDLYIVAKLPQAIPQAHSQLQISNGAWQHYYLRSYAAAFEHNQPAIFVDAVGPGNFLFKSRSEAHEAFPYLRSEIHAKYTLVADRHGTRIYVRNDRMSPSPNAAPAN